MTKTVCFTERGLRKYQEEIDGVQNELTALQSRIADVAEHGGDQWHDNASYDYVTAEIRQNDKRLRDMIAVLNRGIIIGLSMSCKRVDIGVNVRVLWNDVEYVWYIGGYGESDIDNNILAYNTPLADIVMGKTVGETCISEIAHNKVTIKILEISVPK